MAKVAVKMRLRGVVGGDEAAPTRPFDGLIWPEISMGRGIKQSFVLFAVVELTTGGPCAEWERASKQSAKTINLERGLQVAADGQLLRSPTVNKLKMLLASRLTRHLEENFRSRSRSFNLTRST